MEIKKIRNQGSPLFWNQRTLIIFIPENYWVNNFHHQCVAIYLFHIIGLISVLSPFITVVQRTAIMTITKLINFLNPSCFLIKSVSLFNIILLILFSQSQPHNCKYIQAWPSFLAMASLQIFLTYPYNQLLTHFMLYVML